MIYEYAPWEYYPKFLASHEVKNPLLVITDFFSYDHLKGFKDQLAMWKSYAIAEEAYEHKSAGTVMMVFRYEHNVRLVEALYLLLLDYPSRDKEAMYIADEQLSEETEKWIWFPKNLSKEELKNPFKVIKEVFDDISMPNYREQLHDWFIDALSVSSILMMYKKKELKRLYRHQVRLYSVAWLFKQRETPYPHYKKAEEVQSKEETKNSI